MTAGLFAEAGTVGQSTAVANVKTRADHYHASQERSPRNKYCTFIFSSSSGNPADRRRMVKLLDPVLNGPRQQVGVGL